eukprot:10834322-Karenia_brevis.AAC.1
MGHRPSMASPSSIGHGSSSGMGILLFGGRKLHRSHRATWFGGVIHCTECGHCFKQWNALRQLSHPCCVNSTK